MRAALPIALVLFPPLPGNKRTSSWKDETWTLLSITSHGNTVASRLLLRGGSTVVRSMTN